MTAADVTFFNAEANRSAVARTDEKGQFRLTTFSPNDGAVAGKQTITVLKLEAPPAVKEYPTDDPRYDPFGAEKLARMAPPKNSIPKKYADQKSTDLFATITEGANDDIKLELRD